MNVSELQAPMVFVIDDDDGMRAALANLLEAVGIAVRCFSSAEQFLAEEDVPETGCLILDVRLPGASGLQFQDELVREGIALPIIFITAHGDIPMSVRAMKAGAVEFLPKPFRDQDLLDAVQLALKRDRARVEAERAGAGLRARYDALTPPEREILRLVAAGLMNKQIAGELNLAEITVKIHRGSLARKLGARSVVDLVKMSEALGDLTGGSSRHTNV